MSIGIYCFLKPEIALEETLETDGKNLAEAFVATSLADTELPADNGVFDPLLPLIGGTLSGEHLKWHSPAAGLAALAKIIERLQEPASAKLIADPDLRSGCIWDLEVFMKILRKAQTHGSVFSLVYDL